MKRATSIVLLFALGLSAIAQNLIINPGFESWTAPDKPAGWSIAKYCLKDSVNQRSQAYCCRHLADISATKYLGQSIPVTPGTSYKLSFHYKTEITNDEHGCRIWCHWEDAESNNITDPVSEPLLHPSGYMDSETWQFYSIETVAPSNASVFCLEVRTYQNSIAFWDDFTFEETLPTSVPETERKDPVIYPNPALEYLTISHTSVIQHVDILNLTGTTIWSVNSCGTYNIIIPVSSLPNGIYIIRIVSQGKSITRKFIKKAH